LPTYLTLFDHLTNNQPGESLSKEMQLADGILKLINPQQQLSQLLGISGNGQPS
jgi:hypothetical protein